MLYGCKTWSLTLWEARRSRVFEKMLLMRIFGNEELRRLHNEELHNPSPSRNISGCLNLERILKWADCVAIIEKGETAFKIEQAILQERDL